jgi:pimeloyl-ACP methyl ester carboxylesterase
MPYLTRGGVRLYYEDHGQGLPVLLSHGFGASTGMWRGQVEALQHSYRLIPWDMRGHGESDSPEAQALYSHQHTVEDMRALLDHLHIEQTVMAGHSLGGFMSLAFHVAYPQRVQALILQGCGPGLGRLNRCQKFPRYLALRYALRFCQAMEVADNTLCSGMVTSSSTSEHAPCNNS